jgi:hypothetical protein
MSVHINKRERVIKGGRNRKKRPKTFVSEDKAHAYAKENGIEKYTLEHLSAGQKKKIRIVA